MGSLGPGRELRRCAPALHPPRPQRPGLPTTRQLGQRIDCAGGANPTAPRRCGGRSGILQKVEPTGFEPVTSCVQTSCPAPVKRAIEKSPLRSCGFSDVRGSKRSCRPAPVWSNYDNGGDATTIPTLLTHGLCMLDRVRSEPASLLLAKSATLVGGRVDTCVRARAGIYRCVAAISTRSSWLPGRGLA
jgi:hypothetical protein